MPLLSFLKRRRPVDEASGRPRPGAQPLAAGQVDEIRQRARRRLIGAAVLVVAAVVGLPLLFESKPRPVAADASIAVARREAGPAAGVVVPPPMAPSVAPSTSTEAAGISPRGAAPAAPGRASGGMITESAGEAGREVAPPLPVLPRDQAAARAAPEDGPAASGARPGELRPVPPADGPRPPRPRASEAAVPPARKAESRPAEPRPRPVDEAARARALLDGKDVERSAKPAATTGSGRFMVQVGAFGQKSSADTAVEQVSRLGLKAYTQEVDTAAGKRIRVRLGPYASREEAERAAARLRAGGQAAAIVPQ